MEGAASKEKIVLRINLDETSICAQPVCRRGTVCLESRVARSIGQKANKRLRRTNLTYVAVICDVREVQQVLPQFLLSNEGAMRKRDAEGLAAMLRPTTILIRRRSAWNDQRMMVEILRKIATQLQPFLTTYQPVLFLDAARQHTTQFVLASAVRLRLWPIIIPAGSTFLLQPLDTHAFSLFKRRLEEGYNALAAEGNAPSIDLFLRSVKRAIEGVIMQCDWACAFDANGFSTNQAKVSERVRSALGLSAPLDIEMGVPQIDTVTVCFPKRARVPWETVLAPILPRRHELRRSRPLSSNAAPALIYGRTRSQTRLIRDGVKSA